MMIALDTNVISEVTKPHPDRNVIDWIFRQSPDSLAIPSVVLAELHRGINLLPHGNQRQLIDNAVRRAIASLTVLDFNEKAAQEYGTFSTMKGRPAPTMDALIAATCSTHGAILATRNTADFADFPIELINPWEPVLF